MLWSGNMDRQGPRRLAWLWDAPASARRSLLAAWLGWLLDGFDVMLYALVLSALRQAADFDPDLKVRQKAAKTLAGGH